MNRSRIKFKKKQKINTDSRPHLAFFVTLSAPSWLVDMTLYWLYDLPIWLFATICILFFVLIAVIGLWSLRPFIFKRVIPQAHNDVVSYFMAGMNAIYGITLGLIAVAAWENYSDLDDAVSKEAASLAALYQDVRVFPNPVGDSLRSALKEYTRYTIEEAWPQQQRGMLPIGGTARLTVFQAILLRHEPETRNQEIMMAEIFRQFNHLIELRRIRLQGFDTGLPASVWYVIFFGAILNVIITWFFVFDKFHVHVLMTALFAGLLGSLFFLVAVMDNPFRGHFGVSSEAFEIIYENMKRQ